MKVQMWFVLKVHELGTLNSACSPVTLRLEEC